MLAATLALRQAQGEGELQQKSRLILSLSKDDRGQELKTLSAARCSFAVLGDRVGFEPTTSRFEAGDCAASASGRRIWLTRQDSNLHPLASQASADPFSFGSLVLGGRFELPCRAV